MPANQRNTWGGTPSCQVCEKSVYYNEQKIFMSRAWHTNCFKCVVCSKRLESGTASLNEEDCYCMTCYRKNFVQAEPKKKVEVYVNPDDPDCCPRCGKRVYFAEQFNALQRKWHQACFTCSSCSKKVESLNACDHNGELFCRGCYARKFGPKGYGFAGGSGMGLSMEGDENEAPSNVPKTAEAYLAPVKSKMADMSIGEGDVADGNGHGNGHGNGMNGNASHAAVHRWGGGEYCPRCSKQVFIAEKRAAAGNSYHASCFRCLQCSKKLEQGKLTEREGEIFCNPCYSREFGPKGYGFSGGAGNGLMSPT